MESGESIHVRTIEIVYSGSSKGIKCCERELLFDSNGVPVWSQVIPVVENYIYEKGVESYNQLTTPVLLSNGCWLTHYRMGDSGESVFVRILPAPGMPAAAV